MNEEKIVVTNTAIIINDYNLGDCEPLENIFRKWDPITHKYQTFGYFYDEANKRLYLPSGMDLWKIKNWFNQKYYKRETEHPYQSINNILAKYRPRDNEQVEALKFMAGIDQYADNYTSKQLSVNLNTGKGKTYCSICTICFFKIKSMIITGSNTLLSQWESEIIKYTNLNEKDIFHIVGSDTCNMILRNVSTKARDASIFLCSHGTLRSFGDTYGWDKVYELFEKLGIGIKFFDEAHTNYLNMLMIDFFTNVYKTFYVTATPGRSDWRENVVYQIASKNIPAIDLFNPDKDPHTSYIALKYNSNPGPKVVSRMKNKYGIDRMKYVDWITTNDEFYKLLHVIMGMIKRIGGRTLMYIGTNDGILRVYHWIATNYPEYVGDIGIFSSLVSQEDKLKEKGKKLLLSTTKSAGLGEHIEGLKTTVCLAEPFKSEIIARQTLGRTRDSDTYYIEVVDLAFYQIKNFYFGKLPVFNKYAKDTSDAHIDSYELEKRAQKIIDKRDIWQRRPLVLYDQRFDFTEVLKYQEKKELEKKNKPYCPIHFVANPNYKPDWLKKLEKEEEES